MSAGAAFHQVWGESSVSSSHRGSSSSSYDAEEIGTECFVKKLDKFKLACGQLAASSSKSSLGGGSRGSSNINPAGGYASEDIHQQPVNKLEERRLCKVLEKRPKAKVQGKAETTEKEEEQEEEEDESQEESQERPSGVFSVGSLNHDKGECKPCHYVNSKNGCDHGQSCFFCHLDHSSKPSKSKHRPCKTKRIMMKRLASSVNSKTLQDDPDKFKSAVEELLSLGEFTSSLALARMKKITDPALVERMEQLNLDGLSREPSVSSKLSL
eukprot:TRINITY_DN19883_c0_g1_i2.p1 TRINITY_DN19883_c0_g1~~TRINITY_DN19883_c0_g1_i2.p1  ORF type:complete len:284 (-),score=37.91 TRINITY_DN19883_c0_g1_i2:133-939(-)